MQRVTASPEMLVDQACTTAECYLARARRWTRDHEIAEDLAPTYVAMYVQAAAMDFLTSILLSGLQDVAESWSREVDES